MNPLSRWWTFARERFDPLSHGIMISVFLAAHFAWSGWPKKSPVETALLLVGVVAFFFKLRLYDEIKDYETDLKVNPTRPLARGLVSHRDLYLGIVVCVVVESGCFLFFGWGPWFTYLIALAYSGLMFKEFFIGRYLRPHLTTYAVTHTFVSVLLSLAIFAAIARKVAWELEPMLWRAALSSWCVFNIFEFARKTFALSEERPTVESYSKIFGRGGATFLVFTMARFAAVLAVKVTPTDSLQSTQFWLVVGVAVVGILFAFQNSATWAKIYRLVGSLYIIAFYLSIILASGVF